MCGISLIFDKTNLLSQAPIQKMVQSGNVRGPDANHYIKITHDKGQLYLGHNRLRIIDTNPEADQPFISSDQRYILIFNGAIYNFFDLRNALLQKGYLFRTQSDTEVLLYHLVEYGAAGIRDLNGMYGFAFHDVVKGTTLIGRDSMGMKPVFYYEDENYFIIGTQIQNILASGLVEKKLARHQIDFYLKYRYACPPDTFFENIKCLLPGCLLQVNKSGQAVLKEINPKNAKTEQGFSGNLVNEEQLLNEVDQRLKDALLKHIHTDVPYGIFLSGGTDSTLLLALLNHLDKSALPSYSIVNTEKEKSFGTKDYYYARKAARHYDAIHHEITLDGSILKDFENYVYLLDQPIGDSAFIMTNILSEKASMEAKMVLSGAGADELFAGYNRHWAYYQYLKNYRSLEKWMPALNKFAGMLPVGRRLPWRKQIQLLKKLLINLDLDPAKTFDNFTCFGVFSKSRRKENLGKGNKEKSKQLTENSIEERLNEALNKDLKNYLPNDILALSDDMSMKQSLEMRMPYLDDNLVAFVNNIESVTRIKHGRKWILQTLLNKYNGSVFTKRKKEGMGLPFGQWLREDRYYKHIRHLLEDKNRFVFHFIDFQFVQQLKKLHLTGKVDYSQEIFSFITLSAWLEINFGGDPRYT